MVLFSLRLIFLRIFEVHWDFFYDRVIETLQNMVVHLAVEGCSALEGLKTFS